MHRAHPLTRYSAGMSLSGKPIRLIVNADDFGLTPGVNRAIAELARAGALSAAPQMAGGPAVPAALAPGRPGPPAPPPPPKGEGGRPGARRATR